MAEKNKQSLQEALNEGLIRDFSFIIAGTLAWFLGFFASEWHFIFLFHFGYLIGILIWIYRIKFKLNITKE